MSTPARKLDAPEIVFVVAVAENGVIGADGVMPWRLSSDLQRFKRLTLGRPVIMGRKTYASIGRALPGRTNIVLSRDAGFAAPGVVSVASPAHALEVARADAQRRGADQIAVIGGAKIFHHWMPLARRLELTRVHATPAGDTMMPELEEGAWTLAGRETHPAGAKDSAAFSYETWLRR